MVDKAQQLYETLLSCSPDDSPYLPPLSQFLRHLWRQRASASLSFNDATARTRFIFEHLSEFHSSRAPYRCPFPVELIEWLNAPAVDLSSHIPTHPTLESVRPSAHAKYLTRLMMYVWQKYAKQFDVFQEDGFYGFLTWYALRLMKDWNLPTQLLPQTAVELLNQPAADETVPMTVCMLVNERSKQVSLLHDMPRAALFAACFTALEDVLNRGDVRLLPSYVSHFWRDHAFCNGMITRYEYVAAAAFAGESPTSDAEQSIRSWFISDYLSSHPSAMVFSGLSPVNGGHQPAVPPSPMDDAVLTYRDHSTVCGLSKAGLQATSALRSSGFQVVDLDYALPRDRMQAEYARNASLLTNSRRRLHILNINPEYVPECLLLNLTRVKPWDYIVGQFYWELSNISAIHETGLALVDEIWVASDYLVNVYSRHTSKPVIRMGQAVREPPPSSLGRSYFDLPEKDYLFLVSFDAMSCIERKNPLAAARAFRSAFPKGIEPAGLILKTRNAAHVTGNDLEHWKLVLEEARQDRRIRIIDRTFSEAEMTGLLEACDCYVSLHRSEGFGYGPAEALLQGKPVITTNYSAVCDFCTYETSLLVPYELTAPPPGAYPYMDTDRSYLWAAPNIQSASEQMCRLFDNPAEGRRLGQRGRRVIQTEYSTEALSRRYQARLAELGFRADHATSAREANVIAAC